MPSSTSSVRRCHSDADNNIVEKKVDVFTMITILYHVACKFALIIGD